MYTCMYIYVPSNQNKINKIVYTIEPPNKGHIGSETLFFIRRLSVYLGGSLNSTVRTSIIDEYNVQLS